jgi:hypothetical protein
MVQGVGYIEIALRADRDTGRTGKAGRRTGAIRIAGFAAAHEGADLPIRGDLAHCAVT